jgi:N-acetylglutamate synthase-like GNAT family acetyltransferase
MLLRDGQEPDRPRIGELLAYYQMEADLDPVEFLVAEVDGLVVGAARLEWADGQVYLRPLVIAAGWHQRGIGRALVSQLLSKSTGLRVVARGNAAGFYERLGFERVNWEQVFPAFVGECQDCQYHQSCQPVPMAAGLIPHSFE